MFAVLTTYFCFLLFACRLTESVQSFKDPDPTAWPGHLEPLASRLNPIPVENVDKFPGPQEFYLRYVYPSVPAIFKNDIKRSPAFFKWTDNYLKNHRESAVTLVNVETMKKEDRGTPVVRMPLAEFMDRYQTREEYLVTGVPKFLQSDVLIPTPLLCDPILGALLDSSLWISSGGTKSVLHTDSVENINCVFSGTKDFLLLNTTKYKERDPSNAPEDYLTKVDVERVDFTKYPFLADAEFFIASVTAGECLYLPYNWLHQVRSHGRNIAVNVLWDYFVKIVPTPSHCGTPNPRTTVADVIFQEHEQRRINNMKIPELNEQELNTNTFVNLLTEIKDADDKTYTYDEFVTFLKQATLQDVIRLTQLKWTEEVTKNVKEVFETLDFDSNGKLTALDAEYIENANFDVIKEVVVSKVYQLVQLLNLQTLEEKQQHHKELKDTMQKLNQSADNSSHQPRVPTDHADVGAKDGLQGGQNRDFGRMNEEL